MTETTTEERKGLASDDSAYDGTLFAEPAYWRGHDDCAKAICTRLQFAIDGHDNGIGVLGYSELEKIRRWILTVNRKEAK